MSVIDVDDFVLAHLKHRQHLQLQNFQLVQIVSLLLFALCADDICPLLGAWIGETILVSRTTRNQ